MAYYSEERLNAIGFKRLGENVKISENASIYDPGSIEIGNNSRIDDFCVISGNLIIGSYCHITPMCLVAGGAPGIILSDFCTLAYGVKIFAQSDDYSGATLVNSMIPKKYKNEFLSPVFLGQHVVVGAGSIIFPGVSIGEGCAIGAMTLLLRNAESWGIYAGSPARRIKERKKDLLVLEEKFKKEELDD